MIRIVVEDAAHRAYLFCDHCNKRITDADGATVVWPLEHGGAAIKTSCPQYVHKSGCHGATEKRLREQGYRIGSGELRTHLRQLQVSLNPIGKAAGAGKVAVPVAPHA